jgi:hypothetical protein
MDPIQKLESTNDGERIQAAVTLAYARPSGAAQALVQRLAREQEMRAAAGCCAALEMIGDKTVLPELVRLLETCPDDQVWDIAHAIGHLAGVHPLMPLRAGVEVRRRTWLEAVSRRGGPRIADVSADANFVRFVVDEGAGRIRSDYDPPPPGTSTWPRWNRSLFVGGIPLYSIGSTCGTCELILKLVGWSADRAFAVSRELSASMEQGAHLSTAWVQQWSPLLGELETGHYLGARFEMPVERVDDAAASWMTLRYLTDGIHDPEAGAPAGDGASDWPGAAHYQGPSFSGLPTTYWVVLPSQNLATLDETRVNHYVRQIQSGSKPTALALGWLEERGGHGDGEEERFVVLFVLDGHHKLEAYARCAQAASVIGLFHLESTWGPPEDRARPLIEALRQLRHETGRSSNGVPASLRRPPAGI